MGLKLEIKKAERKLKKIENNFKNTKKLLNNIGSELNKNIKDLFESKKSPFGVKWIPSKSNPDTLVDTGALKSSGQFKTTESKVVIEYGSGLKYARIHNDGVGKMPKRQFVPNKGKLPKDWRKQTESILKKGLFGDIK
jgi:phage gpG-like protein